MSEWVTYTCLHKYWTCDNHTLAHMLNMWQTHTCTSTEQVTHTCLHMYWTGHTHMNKYWTSGIHTLAQVLNKWQTHTCTSTEQMIHTHLHKYWENDTHTCTSFHSLQSPAIITAAVKQKYFNENIHSPCNSWQEYLRWFLLYELSGKWCSASVV